jgi:hypothetical protein
MRTYLTVLLGLVTSAGVTFLALSRGVTYGTTMVAAILTGLGVALLVDTLAYLRGER